MLRLMSHLLAAASSLVLLTSCLFSNNVPRITYDSPPEFNERIRLDREASGEAPSQPQLGRYRDGYDGNSTASPESEVASEFFPEFPGCPSNDPEQCSTEFLLQSDCYWAGANSDSAFDVMTLNWEVVVDPAEGLFTNSMVSTDDHRTFGVCRFREPGTGIRGRAPDDWDFNDLPESTGGFDIAGLQTGLVYPDPPPELTTFDLGFDWPWAAARVKAAYPSNSAGVCPARQSLNDEWVSIAADGPFEDITLFETSQPPTPSSALATLPITCQPLNDDGLLSGCGYRCGLLPTKDAAYRIDAEYTIAETGEKSATEREIQTNLLVVPKRRKIVRPLQSLGSVLEWKTNVLRNGDAAARWHENFSPNVLVESVRVFGRDNSGNEVPLDLTTRVSPHGVSMPVLSLFGLNNAGYECLGQTLAPNNPEGLAPGTWFPLFNAEEGPGEVICLADGTDDVAPALLATPTYLREQLAAAASPLLKPLEWSVFPNVPLSVEAHIEFTLSVESAGSSALSSKARIDFGKHEPGSEQFRLVTVRNVGSTLLEIDSLTVVGRDSVDFTARSVSMPEPLPLPFEVTSGGELDMISGFASDLDPIVELTLSSGDPVVRVKAIRSTTPADAYGTSIDLSNGFPLAASPPSQVPEPQNGGTLMLGFPIYFDRTLPFHLAPEETFTVATTSQPSSYGTREAEIVVGAHAVANPSESAFTRVLLEAQGAAAEVATVPSIVQLPRRGSYEGVALLENPGSLPLTRTAIQVTGPHAHHFSVESAHDPSLTLQPGDAEYFSVRYNPAGQVPAGLSMHQATLEVDTSVGAATWQLAGRDPLLVQPGGLAFGHGGTLKVTVTNISEHRVTIRRAFTSGTDAGLFHWENPVADSTLATNGSQVIHIRYAPHCGAPVPTNVTNTREATFHIVTDWGDLKLPLRGEFSLFGCN